MNTHTEQNREDVIIMTSALYKLMPRSDIRATFPTNKRIYGPEWLAPKSIITRTPYTFGIM